MHLSYQADFFQFMVEMEADWKLPFFNVLVNRNNRALSFNVYRREREREKECRKGREVN